MTAQDSVDATGIATMLSGRSEIVLLPQRQEVQAEVVVFVADPARPVARDLLRAFASRTCARFVLVSEERWVMDLLGAAQLGLAAVVPRREVTPDRLTRTILTVHRGGAELPSATLGKLLAQIGRLQREVLGPRGLNVHGFDNREVDVLRLLAEGFATREIADKLSYSERTVKNILHALIARLQVRNRVQAVAFAIRVGAI
ncbi:MAG TPA: response regulator transcription factor [Pseudonocardiaceae bacterium]|nr:response regulator transcription factor [Pseudonocardiaceae bacterium]